MIQNADDCWLNRRWSVGVFLSFSILSQANLSGQVVLDGKFGSGGALSGPAFDITADKGAVRGNNLFHSFQQFDLKAGDVATFSGPANVQNILSRVTSGAPSSIDGKIRSQIAGANFFLINPSGLIFGPNATIEVSGAFAASTANYLKLADGAKFFASLDADDSTLTTAPVSAFGFLGGNSGAIVMDHSGLQAPDSGAVSIVGGDVSIQGGFLRTSAGEINVASIKTAGEIPANLGSLNADDFRNSFPSAGQIALHEDARIDASGEGGGRIVIRGGSLQVDNSRIEANTFGAAEGRGIDIATTGDVEISNKGQINSLTTLGAAAGGNIAITANSIRLLGDGTTDDFFNPTTQISSGTGDMFGGGGPAKGGDISLKAQKDVVLANSAQVSAASFGAGDAGRIDIEASHVSLDAPPFTPTQINANTQGFDGAGKAGDIHIRAGTVDLMNGATILATSFGPGPAGLIDIQAESIKILHGSIVTAGAFGTGNGGNVEVNARLLVIDGQDKVGGEPDALTGIQAVTTDPINPTPGGNIHVNADVVSLDHSGSIFTSSITGAAGKGGDINVTGNQLTLANGSTIRASGDGTGPAGAISVNTTGDINLTGGSAINTSAPGSSGGNITVRSGSEIFLSNSEINAQAGLDGGSITVSAAKLVYLLRGHFTARADTTGTGFGNGGNITIEPSQFLILNLSELVSSSSFGNGGNISIFADNFFQSASTIDASAPFGLPGTVKVTAPEVDLSGSLIGLPGNLLDAEAQLRPDCGVRLSGNVSSFIVLGRGGLPLEPGGFLPSGMVRTNK